MNESLASLPPDLSNKVTSMRNLVSQGIVPVVFYVLYLKPDRPGHEHQHDERWETLTHSHFDRSLAKTITDVCDICSQS